MRLRTLLVLFLLLSVNTLFGQVGLDELFMTKQNLIKQFPPDNRWVFLEVDPSFKLDFHSTDSFLSIGVCLKVKEKRLIAVDNRQHQLMVFEDSGKFKEAVGREGRGPGDLLYPTWMEIYQDNIYVDNNNGIEVFDGDLKFVRRIRSFLEIYRFTIADDFMYCTTRGVYKEKYPLFLKLNLHGGVEEAVYSPDLDDPLFKISKEGDILILNGQVILVPKHWNRMYVYDKQLKTLKKVSIKYKLLDLIQRWNQRNLRREQKNVLWFSNLTAAAKVFRGRIYLLFKLPRVEIIGVDTEGNIVEHFYNDKDLRYARWFDFVIQEEEGMPVFYVMGFAGDIQKKRGDLHEYDIFRLIPGGYKMKGMTNDNEKEK
jgi:hypothetical protein